LSEGSDRSPDDGRTIARGWLPLRPGPLSGARTADQCAHLPLPPLPEGHGLAVLCARPISHGPGDGDGSDGALPIVTRALARLLPTCGTRVLAERPSAGRMGIALAAFDDPNGLAPECHIFVASKLACVRINDDLPQYAEWPPS